MLFRSAIGGGAARDDHADEVEGAEVDQRLDDRALGGLAHRGEDLDDLADRHALPPSVAARHVFLAGLVASSVVEMTTRRFHAVPSAFVTWLAHREVTDESR